MTLASGSASGCPSEDELVRMVEGALGDASLASIEAHVDRCERCAAVIAGLGALGRGAGAGPAPAPPSEAAPDGRRTVGRYQLDRRIAAGGMGEVWAAWDPQLRREIAVKLVRPERADDDRERERLLREARALARLGHPNVLAVHDVGELPGGEVFIATELVAGETLASRGGPSASWRELVRLYTQAARGLAAAHAAGLVHRDVKPSNLLLGIDGRVRVADFGLAVRSSPPSPIAATELPTDEVPVRITASGFVAGTPAYMAPEQRAGRPPDARADQYALCVSLVEAIDGRRPPAGVDRDALIAFVSERRAPEPELDALCGVLARGLSADPRKRFPDADALAEALERVHTTRELESAATVSAAELPPLPGSGPHSTPGGPSSDPGSRPSTGPRPHPSTGPRPRSDSALRPRAPAPTAARPRRIAPLAIAGVAAAAGVVAVLLAARALSNKPARPAAGAGSAIAETTPPPVEPSVEPIGPGSADPTASAEDPDRAPSRPAGVPLDLPRAPANKTVAVAPPAGGYADLSSFVTDIQKHLRLRDVRACKRLIAGLPGNLHPSQRFSVDTFAASCEMMAGDCAGGTARLTRAQAAQGLAPQPEIFVEQYCPIEGNLETRLARLRSQVGAHTMGSAMNLAWCEALVPHARKAAGEASTGPQRGTTSYVLHQLAKCLGSVARCDEARALWSLSNTVDETNKWRKPDLGAKCAAASDALASAESYADPTQLLQGLTAALQQRDVRGCQRLVASQPPNVHPTHKHSIELLQAHCEMISGNCAAGTARLQRIGPNPGGPPVDPAIHAGWLRSNVDMYCPITGDLDARLARLWAKVDAFTSRGGGGLVAWCDALVAPARTAAGEVSTARQRQRAARVLQRLASCVAGAGRCDQGRDLWALAAQTDPSTPATPALGAKCP
jgi:serine/threonine protein kinase